MASEIPLLPTAGEEMEVIRKVGNRTNFELQRRVCVV